MQGAAQIKPKAGSHRARKWISMLGLDECPSAQGTCHQQPLPRPRRGLEPSIYSVLVPAVGAAHVAGLPHFYRRERRERGAQALPEPAGQMFTGGIFEAGDLVQHVMVELNAEWLERRGNVVEIPHPARALIHRAGDRDADLIRMPMHAGARMRLRYARQPVRGLEGELGEQFHYLSPRTLCVCTESRHCGWPRQYAIACCVLSSRFGPSIGCRKKCLNRKCANRSGSAPS